MPRTLLSIPLLLIMALLIAAAATLGVANALPVNGEYDSDGDGLIEIEFLEQLDAIRYDLDGDGRADDDSGVEAYAAAFPGTVCNNCNGYELARPLDFASPDSYTSGAVNAEWTAGEGWEPIGDGRRPLATTFNGNGHDVSNLYITLAAEADSSSVFGFGLFGSVGVSGVIREIGLLNVNVAGGSFVGPLAGVNLGTVSHSYATGSVSGYGCVGGLVGSNDFGVISSSYATSSVSGGFKYLGGLAGCNNGGTITASYATGSVSGDIDVGGLVGNSNGSEIASIDVGGLVGKSNGSVIASYATGSVRGQQYVGGLVGENEGYIVASQSSADVAGNTGVGGLAGVNRLFISGSYATGSVSGGSAVGGLAGYNGAVGKIIASYATGAVTGSEGAGGLAGENAGGITASYAIGQVSGNENVGGLAGRNADEAGITASYATGRVSGRDNAGGVIGLNAANVTEAVWDTETSGVDNGVGRGDASGVTGKTTAEVQAATGYVGVYRDWKIYLEDGEYRDFEETTGPHEFWDFGTSAQYPVLKSYLSLSGIVDWWESGGQPRDARPPAPTPPPVMAVSPAFSRYDSDGDRLIDVSNLEQLDAIRYDLDGDGIPEGEAKDDYASAYPVPEGEEVCGNGCRGYELARPLDFGAANSYATGAGGAEWAPGKGWRPIGDKDAYGRRFNAIFEGNGHAIANLYISRTAPSDEPPAIGLFGYTGYSAVVRNTGLVNASVAGLENVGGLAGWNKGEIRDSYTTGSVSARDRHAGGLVGENEGAISGSHASVSVSCGEYGEFFGGLAGSNEGSIGDSYATASMSCPDSDFVGGLTGGNWGDISGSFAIGDIAGDIAVGGLTGSLGPDGTIIGSYATGDVTGGYEIGGLAGGNSGVIRGSYATGRVTGGFKAGGLAGQNAGTMIASYATGSVSGGGEIGGLVGSNSYGTVIASYASGETSGESSVGGLAGVSNNSTVVASYAVGAVSGSDEIGGLIGVGSQTIRESVSFWDVQTTGQETSAGGAGKTTVELRSPTTHTGIYGGWNVDLDNADGDDDPTTGVDDFWDFGTSSQYPALKVDLDGDGTATWQEFGSQDRTAPAVEPAPHTKPPVPAEDNCVETVAAEGVIYGEWSGACLSFNRPGSYARFYVFTTGADSGGAITLESSNTNTYLYLQKGAGRNSWSSRSQGSPDRYSRIDGGFAAGTYTIESTTYEAEQTGSFRLTISALVETAPEPAAVSPALTVRYDRDGNGLIEISNLEQLDAIRYDLDGDGRADDDSGVEAYAAAFPGTVCNNNCSGYELARPLDFADPDSYAFGAIRAEWTTGDGWRAIGDSRRPFAATFNGNGHAVSNLYITPATQAGDSSVDGFGLFGSVGVSGVIREIGLLNVNVTGGDFVGPLAGASQGTVSHSYATGSVSGYGCVGGLVGSNDFGVISSSYSTVSVLGGYKYLGGLAGCNNGGTIIASYATGSVSGDTRVGGLVGDNSGSVIASYATGSVRGQTYVGGLVGNNDDGSISASYSVSEVTGGNYIGGLAGGNGGMVGYSYAVGKVSSDGSIDAPQKYIGGLVGYNPGIISYGFWDTETSGQQVGIGIEIGEGLSSDIFGKTTAELQSPAGYTGPYRGWDVYLTIEGGENTPDYSLSDFLDFGTSGQYPALKVDFDGDESATWQEFGNQRRDAPGPTPAPTVDNCVAIMTTAVVSGAWSSNCASGSRPGSHARFYTFNLAEPSEVIIDLESGDTDTYLYLLQGAGRTGEALGAQGSSGRSSRIERSLGAGTYTVEVTTYGRAQTGSFTLIVNSLATPPPPRTRTRTSTPTAILPPTPTPTFVPTSTPAPVEATNVPGPTAIPAQGPTPAQESGGACSYPNGETPTGAGAIGMFLLVAPLAMIGGLKFRARRRLGHARHHLADRFFRVGGGYSRLG